MAAVELEALNNGLMDALIVQNTWALGRRAVEVALEVIAGRPASPLVQLPTHVITRANLVQLAILHGGETRGLARPPLDRAPARPCRIGFAIKSPATDFWGELLAGATSGAQAYGATLLLHDSLEGDVNEIGLLRETFNQMIDNIRALVQQLQQEAEIIGPRAQALVTAAAGQAALAEEQTAALERLSQGVERLSQTARQIVSSTQAVSASAAGTLRGVEEAELAVTDSSLRLREIIRRLTEALDLLSERTGQVSEVADVMRDIADQTHLLALNAAIEAADAGPYGRRFGVIAEEVRALAGQALESTEGFLDLAAGMRVAADQALAATQASVRGTDLSMELVTQATGAIEGIADLAQHTNSAVQSITAAAAEQQQTNGELAGFAEQVTGTARQAAQASAALSTVAQDLTEVVARLQDSVAFFRVTPDEPDPPPRPAASSQPIPLASAPVEH
jgi:methyl-accepting chemotaxis protein